MTRKDSKWFVAIEESGEDVQELVTHNNLKEVVNGILKDDQRLVVIKKDETKPSIVWVNELNNLEFKSHEDKIKYINELTGVTEEELILPVTKEVIEGVIKRINSRAINNIEKYLYEVVIDNN